MTTKSKHTKENVEADPQEPSVLAAPASAPIPPGLNDIREDGAPVIGHFVEITKGDDKGLVGTLKEVQGDTAVVVDRKAPLHVVSAPLADVVATDPNGR
jgi:transcription elongation factor